MQVCIYTTVYVHIYTQYGCPVSVLLHFLYKTMHHFPQIRKIIFYCPYLFNTSYAVIVAYLKKKQGKLPLESINKE